MKTLRECGAVRRRGTVQCGLENAWYAYVVPQFALIGAMQVDMQCGAQVSGWVVDRLS